MDIERAMHFYELSKKKQALMLLQKALALDGKWTAISINDAGTTVTVKELEGGVTKKVNVNMDNIPAMLYDVLKQARDILF